MNATEPSRHNREVTVSPYVSKLLLLVALVVFVLAAFGVDLGSMTPVQIVAAGLAFLAASFLIP